MSNPKYKHTFFLLFCVTVIIFGTVALAGAQCEVTRPWYPAMDYVPQNVGIYDTYYQNFKESDCRYCHGASTADRHHMTWPAMRRQCSVCHPDPLQIPPERDCKICHIDGGIAGGAPHHKTQLANSGECTACHNPNLLVELNKGYVPSYEPSEITPTPYACENCHWPSGAAPHQAPLLADWNSWTGWPVPSHWPDGLAVPAAIEANGPLSAGWGPYLNPAKAYMPTDGTHHEINGQVYTKCYFCHADDYGEPVTQSPCNRYNIRYCENCHDVYTLHGISEHVTGNNIYRVNGAANKTVSRDAKCAACHADRIPTAVVPPPTPVPTDLVAYMEMGPGGMIVDLTLPTPNESFGTYEPGIGDTVIMSDDGGSTWTLPGEVPIYSWTESKIQIKIPPTSVLTPPVDPTKAYIRVVKAGTPSNVARFVLTYPPVVSSLSAYAGAWGSSTTINGGLTGSFTPNDVVGGNNQYWCNKITDGTDYDCYYTYVELHASNDDYRIKPGNYSGVSSSTLTVLLQDMFDIRTGNPVPNAQEFYPGNWDIDVVTDYFTRTTNADASTYLTSIGKIDPNAGNTFRYRIRSNPKTFVVTYAPAINSILPNPVKSQDTITIYGVNFGTSGPEAMGDVPMNFLTGNKAAAKGNEDGICNSGEACGVKIYNKKDVFQKWDVVTSWSNTAIQCLAPKVTLSPKVKKISVLTRGGVESAKYTITVNP